MNFFSIIGAQRSGTTLLYNLLDQHPEIALAKPVRPEPKFFMDPSCMEVGKADYLSRFYTQTPSTKILGEKTTSYIEVPEMLGRMLSFFPQAKAIAILRNPVDRAISNYFFSKKNNIETRSPEEAFLLNVPPPELPFKTSVPPFDYVQRGEYLRYLAPFFETLGPQRLKVILFERLVENTDAVLTDLFHFLNVDAECVKPTLGEERVNTAAFGEEVSDEVLDFLKKHYQGHNRKLSAFLNDPLPEWG